MRILFLTDLYFPSRAANAVRAKVLAETLIACGHDVQVLTTSESLAQTPADYEKPDYVMFCDTTELGKKTFVTRLKNNATSMTGMVSASKKLGSFDVVFVTSPPAVLTVSARKIARRQKAKLVVDIRDIWPDVAIEMGSFKQNSPFSRVFRRISQQAYDAADLISTVSQHKVEKIASYVGVKHADKVALVPNGLDEAFLEQEIDADIVNRFDLEHGPICAYVGNIGLAQGLSTMLDLAQARPDVRFLLFGGGADEGNLRERAQSEGLDNVEFCGRVDAKGAYTVLKHATLAYVPLLNSSLSDSVPTKMFEALGCGCPVLLAANGESTHILDECGLGLHVRPEDALGLQAAFEALIEDPYPQEQKNNASAHVVRHYSRQTAARHLAELIASL